MSIRYIYLDDEPSTAVRPYVRAVESQVDGLKIDHLHPQAYPVQMAAIREEAQSGSLSGLILDLRLDQFPDHETGKKQADYRAATIAQEIRTRATEGAITAFPIVLWSTDERLRRSYAKDDTSHDLFDLKTVKEQIEDRQGARKIAARLVALVDGYAEIRKLRLKRRGDQRGAPLLGFDEVPSFLDERIFVQFQGRDGAPPVHETARFILRELLDTPGPLIDLPILAARLGVDRFKSPGFEKVVNLFKEASYIGAFSGGWPQWWAAKVDLVWRSLDAQAGPLRATNAAERVALLRKHLGIRSLVPAEPSLPGGSTAFWTVCQASGVALDPKDGFLLDHQPQYQWQDRLYVSLAALVDGTAKAKRIQIDPLENDRFLSARSRLTAQ